MGGTRAGTSPIAGTPRVPSRDAILLARSINAAGAGAPTAPNGGTDASSVPRMPTKPPYQ